MAEAQKNQRHGNIKSTGVEGGMVRTRYVGRAVAGLVYADHEVFYQENTNSAAHHTATRNLIGTIVTIQHTPLPRLRFAGLVRCSTHHAHTLLTITFAAARTALSRCGLHRPENGVSGEYYQTSRHIYFLPRLLHDIVTPTFYIFYRTAHAAYDICVKE